MAQVMYRYRVITRTGVITLGPTPFPPQVQIFHGPERAFISHTNERGEGVIQPFRGVLALEWVNDQPSQPGMAGPIVLYRVQIGERKVEIESQTLWPALIERLARGEIITLQSLRQDHGLSFDPMEATVTFRECGRITFQGRENATTAPVPSVDQKLSWAHCGSEKGEGGMAHTEEGVIRAAEPDSDAPLGAGD